MRAQPDPASAGARTVVDAAFRACRDGLLLVAADHTVREANDAWSRLTGFRREDVVGRRLFDLPAWRDALDVERLRTSLAVRQPVHDLPLALVRAAAPGTPEAVHALVTALPVTDGGESAVLLLVRDVRELEQADARRGHLHRLEELGRLAGGIAHDFSNLLSVIRAYAQIIRVSIAAGEPVAEGDVAEIEHAAVRGAQLTRHLLSFSRNRPIERRAVDVNAALRAMQGLLRPLVGSRIHLEYRLAADLPPILADPVQLDQVVLNLVVNAVDAMPVGGRLTIATDRVVLSPDAAAALDPDMAPGEHVRLEVEDTGHGMDEATRARVFEPFFTTKPSDLGTGLGLPVVAGITRRARGAVRVRSTPGLGTTITVLWPSLHGPESLAPDDTLEGSSRTCVMVVEHDPVVRGSIRRLLSHAGFDTAEARDGHEAIERLTTRWAPGSGPAVVVADLRVPGVGGLDGPGLARELARRRTDLPVLFISACADDAHAAVVLPNVPRPVLATPFEAGALAGAVRATLDDWTRRAAPTPTSSG